jgi:hydrogenase maturation protease
VPERLVLCVGNPDRGDDGVGWQVAAQLRALAVPGLRVETLRGHAADLVAAFERTDDVAIVDAVSSGAPAGTLRIIDCAAGQPFAAAMPDSSHGLGVAEAIALGRALGCLPRRCVVYAVEAGGMQIGTALSEDVRLAAANVAARIADACRNRVG